MVKPIPGNNAKALVRADKEFRKCRDAFDKDSEIAVGKSRPSN